MSPTETALVLLTTLGVPLALLTWMVRRNGLPTGPEPLEPPEAPVIPGIFPEGVQIPRTGWVVERRSFAGRGVVVARHEGSGLRFVRMDGAPPGVTLRAQVQLDRLLDSPAYQERIGDPAFDDAVLLRGRPERLRPLLPAEVRAALPGRLGGRVGVEDGAVYWLEPTGWKRAELDGVFEHLAGIVDLLTLPEGGALRRLEDIARTDPVVGIRLDALRQLGAEDAARGAAVARDLLSDAEAEVAVGAALLAGAAGEATLIARLGMSVPAAAWGAALDRLLRGPTDRVLPPLRRALRHRDDAVRVRAVEALAQVGVREDVEVLRELARGVPGVERAIAAIQSRLGDVEAGRVSLADDDRRGALSEPAVPVGALSEASAGSPDAEGPSGPRPARPLTR